MAADSPDARARYSTTAAFRVPIPVRGAYASGLSDMELRYQSLPIVVSQLYEPNISPSNVDDPSRNADGTFTTPSRRDQYLAPELPPHQAFSDDPIIASPFSLPSPPSVAVGRSEEFFTPPVRDDQMSVDPDNFYHHSSFAGCVHPFPCDPSSIACRFSMCPVEQQSFTSDNRYRICDDRSSTSSNVDPSFDHVSSFTPDNRYHQYVPNTFSVPSHAEESLASMSTEGGEEGSEFASVVDMELPSSPVVTEGSLNHGAPHRQTHTFEAHFHYPRWSPYWSPRSKDISPSPSAEPYATTLMDVLHPFVVPASPLGASKPFVPVTHTTEASARSGLKRFDWEWSLDVDCVAFIFHLYLDVNETDTSRELLHVHSALTKCIYPRFFRHVRVSSPQALQSVLGVFRSGDTPWRTRDLVQNVRWLYLRTSSRDSPVHNNPHFARPDRGFSTNALSGLDEWHDLIYLIRLCAPFIRVLVYDARIPCKFVVREMQHLVFPSLVELDAPIRLVVSIPVVRGQYVMTDSPVHPEFCSDDHVESDDFDPTTHSSVTSVHRYLPSAVTRAHMYPALQRVRTWYSDGGTGRIVPTCFDHIPTLRYLSLVFDGYEDYSIVSALAAMTVSTVVRVVAITKAHGETVPIPLRLLPSYTMDPRLLFMLSHEVQEHGPFLDFLASESNDIIRRLVWGKLVHSPLGDSSTFWEAVEQALRLQAPRNSVGFGLTFTADGRVEEVSLGNSHLLVLRGAF
ncbi:hypothetical protein V5O48_004606 [Marasmius crinis-equi]|uniref:Uncharacterized protein n=1 Tax=Marasmius crinis-equi TaxID=585013 RepID=A0ABR3FPV0_9AGAR